MYDCGDFEGVLSYGIGIASFAFTIYLIIGNNFAASLDGWLSGLVTWVAPWAAITLIHYTDDLPYICQEVLPRLRRLGIHRGA